MKLTIQDNTFTLEAEPGKPEEREQLSALRVEMAKSRTWISKILLTVPSANAPKIDSITFSLETFL